MSRFATVAHLRSWAGLCPQLNESAGTIMSRRLRHGAPWLKTVLVQCASAATRNKHNYLHAQFVRLRTRRGPQQAIIAVALSILSIALSCSPLEIERPIEQGRRDSRGKWQTINGHHIRRCSQPSITLSAIVTTSDISARASHAFYPTYHTPMFHVSLGPLTTSSL
jgi:hypothetical protein